MASIDGPSSPLHPIQLPHSPNCSTSSTSPTSTSVPIPWSQMIPLTLIRIANAMTYIVIFPFITEYITSLNVEPSKIGLYAGMAEGSLMLVEALVATFWARMADEYGRKKCLVFGFGLTVWSGAMVGFGKSVWWILFWRGVFGLNPCAVLEKLVLAELAHPSNRTQMFAILSPAFSVGAILGSGIGGGLANPFDRLPFYLGGRSEIFREYPYALPGIVTTFAGLVSIVVFHLCLNETKPTFPPTESQAEIEGLKKTDTHASVRAVLNIPSFKIFIAVILAFQIASFGFWGMFTVYTYTPIAQGGLGLSIDLIGVVLSIEAITYVLLSPFVVPFLKTKLGHKGALLLCFSTFPLQSLVIPFAQWTALNGTNQRIWTVIILQLILKNFGSFAWPLCDNLLFNTLDGYPHLTATASAIQLMAGAGGRAVGPTMAGWLYSISTQYPTATLGRQISWIGLFLLTLPCAMLATQLPRENHHKVTDSEDYEVLPGDEGNVQIPYHD